MSTNFKQLPESYWKEKLTPEEYRVLREKGTEPAFCGLYTDTETSGIYHCKACDTPLFSSKQKYDSGTGWPSFFDILDSGTVELVDDFSHNMERTEVICSTCNSHLGHIFPDYRTKTGKDFCINSVALTFKPQKA